MSGGSGTVLQSRRVPRRDETISLRRRVTMTGSESQYDPIISDSDHEHSMDCHRVQSCCATGVGCSVRPDGSAASDPIPPLSDPIPAVSSIPVAHSG